MTGVEGWPRAAEALVGAPFRLHGRDPAHRPRLRRSRGRARRASAARSPASGYACATRHRAHARAGRSRVRPRRTARPRRARRRALVRPGPCQHHLLIAAGADRFVHAHAGLRRVVASRGRCAGRSCAAGASQPRNPDHGHASSSPQWARCSVDPSAARSARCVGREVDRAIIGGGKREGPRLQELAVTTSSYGQPVPRHLRRHARRRDDHLGDRPGRAQGQERGQERPAVATTYAIRPRSRSRFQAGRSCGVGRIWADGNLLRGEAGDLKAAGTLRVYTGHGDQLPDPLIAADMGAPARRFRGLRLRGVRGSRAGGLRQPHPRADLRGASRTKGAITLADLVAPLGADAPRGARSAALAGFANEGGPLAATLDTIDTLFPLTIDAGGARLTIDPATVSAALPSLLPPPARAWEDERLRCGRGPPAGSRRRRARTDRGTALLRCRARFPAGRATARRPRRRRRLSGPSNSPARSPPTTRARWPIAAARRSGWRRETLPWRIADSIPALAPGADVRVPGRPGVWRIESWEWRERGVELGLLRRDLGVLRPARAIRAQCDRRPICCSARPFCASSTCPAGARMSASRPFSPPLPQRARAGRRALSRPRRRTGFAWSVARGRATIGILAAPVPPSAARLFEPQATLDIALTGPGGGFAPHRCLPCSWRQPLMLVEKLHSQRRTDRACGLATYRPAARARATEAAALAGHPAGTAAILPDDALVGVLDSAMVPGRIRRHARGDRRPGEPGSGLRAGRQPRSRPQAADAGGTPMWRGSPLLASAT